MNKIVKLLGTGENLVISAQETKQTNKQTKQFTNLNRFV